MRKPSRTAAHRPPVRPGRRRRVLAVVVGVLAAVGLGVTPAATAAPSTTPPPTISVALSTSNLDGLGGGAVPGVLAVAGQPIQLVLTLTGTPFNQDVTFNLNPGLDQNGDGQPDAQAASGTFSPSQVTLLAKQSSAVATVTYSAVENGVVITPSITGKGKTPTINAVTSAAFDSLRTLQKVRAGTGPQTIGADTCTATTQETNCGIAVLPQGTTSDFAALSTGTAAGLQCGDRACKSDATIVQFIAGMSGYTFDAPATMIYRCDKTQCGNGGVTKFKVYYSYEPSGPLQVAEACLNKGQTNGDVACVDYVNSQRDNAGDLLLYFNFLHDLRGSGF